MRKLHFDYSMQIDYAQVVAKCFFTIKCIPQNTARQKIEKTQIRLQPEVPYSFGCDGLGNAQIYGVDDIPHRSFVFSISGDAVVDCAPYEEEDVRDLAMIYRHPHGLNAAGEKIRDYYRRLQKELPAFAAGDPLQLAEAIMHDLHRQMQYRAFSTDVKTTAEEAFAQQCGVCQDYAHIFIALMHLAGIPARYVTGLLIGEGQSHAWVEVLADGKWYGLDPTNDMKVTDSHIRIGTGRDARDCMINRGIVHGGGLHTQTIIATVTETGEE